MLSKNPYESPHVTDAPLQKRKLPKPSTPFLRFVGWTGVYTINLILPALLGWSYTNDDAKVGCLIAILIFYVLGLWVSVVSVSYCKKLLFGGYIVGALQFCPFFHLIFGLIANKIVESMGHATPAPPPTIPDGIRDLGLVNSVFGGMMITFLTGGPLILLAIVIGVLFPGKSIRRSEHQ